MQYEFLFFNNCVGGGLGSCLGSCNGDVAKVLFAKFLVMNCDKGTEKPAVESTADTVDRRYRKESAQKFPKTTNVLNLRTSQSHLFFFSPNLFSDIRYWNRRVLVHFEALKKYSSVPVSY